MEPLAIGIRTLKEHLQVVQNVASLESQPIEMTYQSGHDSHPITSKEATIFYAGYALAELTVWDMAIWNMAIAGADKLNGVMAELGTLPHFPLGPWSEKYVNAWDGRPPVMRPMLWSWTQMQPWQGRQSPEESDLHFGIVVIPTLEDIIFADVVIRVGDIHRFSWANAKTLYVFNRLPLDNEIDQTLVVREYYAAWRFLQLPFVKIAVEQAVPEKLAKAQARKSGKPYVPQNVRVVQLRREYLEEATTNVETDRKIGCSFIVSGHWRKQYYPSVGYHRPKWIEKYIKGKGLPLKEYQPTVYRVTR